MSLRARFLLPLCLVAPAWCAGERVAVDGLRAPVEILRDRWGAPHIYASTSDDLFFAQGYMAARDRLFQIDLWRRAGTGKLAEVLGPGAVERDRMARLVSYRGDWEAEWRSYAPDAREIATAFTRGINAYIRSLGGRRPAEFRRAGYDPGLWQPEDCAARIAGLVMVRNLAREVERVADIRKFGLERVEKYLPPDPFVKIEIPRGLDLEDITAGVLRQYNLLAAAVRFTPDQGSNNWVVDGTLTKTGKPLLANDPHRPLLIPSLRKTVHLVGPGWNAIGAGEPALPGIALGHNEHIAFGFTIVGIDQADLYVEKLNPADAGQYLYRGAWRKVETVRETLAVKGRAAPETIELRYTMHGPLIHEDRTRHRAYALRWVGSEPGTAGYLPALSVARAKDWNEFQQAMARYKVPSENMVYADTAGNIGWQPGGLTPVRGNWTGLLPVPGDTGAYEWRGFLPFAEMPRLFNPPAHFIATANHNILPPGYRQQLGYEWALPYRVERIREMLRAGGKFTVADFERMQQDVISVPARRFQKILNRWRPSAAHEAVVKRLLAWDAALTVDSVPATIYALWIAKLPAAVFGPELGARTNLEMLLRTLESRPHPEALAASLDAALKDAAAPLPAWGAIHRLTFRHPLGLQEFSRGPLARPGDAHTVNAAGGGLRQSSGASYRQILDLSDWDRSVMTNVPGESGDPASPHYSDLLEDWAAGRYHPLPFSRRAVEAATIERIILVGRDSSRAGLQSGPAP
jgi:penicillin amidase